MSEPNTPPPPPAAEPTPTSSGGGSGSPNTVMLILSYLGILALIPFLVEKEDKDVQWHAKHGLVLFGAEILVFVALSIVTSVVGGVFGAGLGCFGSCGLVPIFSLAIMVVHLVCIVKAVNGDRFIIPGISQYADKF